MGRDVSAPPGLVRRRLALLCGFMYPTKSGSNSLLLARVSSYRAVLSKPRSVQSIKYQMFARLSQLSRHLSRPLPNYAHTSAASSRTAIESGIMTSSADERNKRMIHSAGCIIIGDEVLGGKVGAAYVPP